MRANAAILEQIGTEHPEVEKTWQEFWRPIVFVGGHIDIEQIKKELYDYRVLMHEVSLVYDAVTGSRISKPHTLADSVIREFEDYVARQVQYALENEREIEELANDGG